MKDSERPHVSLCLATSLDGKISRKPGVAPDFTSRQDLDKLFRLRAMADVLLVGATTVRQESLPPLVRKPEYAAARKAEGKPAHPAVVIVSRSLDLPWGGRYFHKAKQQIFVLSAAVSASKRQRIEDAGVSIIDTGSEMDLAQGLASLKQLGFQKILAEGGGKLNHSLLEAGLVDYLYLTIAPVFIGGQDTPSLCNGPILEPMTRFSLVSQSLVHGELHVEYQVLHDDLI